MKDNKPIPPLPASQDLVENAQAMGAAFDGMVKAMAGLSLPVPRLTELQNDYVQQAASLWNQSLSPQVGETKPVAKPADRRFAAPEWAANPASAYMAQMYLLNARTLMQMADGVDGDPKTRQRIRFAVQQWVDAVSPSNYLALNPRGPAQGGGNQRRQPVGGHGPSVERWSSKATCRRPTRACSRSAATSPPPRGAVVFENELFQLIEYKPLTAKVFERPMLFVPPCINKYYILDLQPENSLIRYTVAQGHRLFVVSWRNADDSMRQFTWDQYIEDAAIRAIGVVQEITGSEKINTLGFCVGGTILSTALAVLAARGEKPAASVTLLTTFLDFSDTGILDLFVDETMVRLREMTLGPKSPNGGALLKGQELASTFSFLRPNDLVWNYVVGNYLKGETPPPFDLLYWNSDSTNLPGPMYCWYLRNTYLENNLVKPGKMTVCGEKVDLGKIDAPAYVYASREDHIVPWDGAYRNTQVLKGKVRFALGASGHIAGVINPPAKGKRSHWLGGSAALPAKAQDWLDKAKEVPGSWWPDWAAWLATHGGKQIAAPKTPGNRTHKTIEPAPGRYVKAKA